MRGIKKYLLIFVLLLPSCVSAGQKLDLATIQAVTAPYTFDVIGDNRGNDVEYRQLVDMMVKDNPSFVINVGDFTPVRCVGTRQFLGRSAPITVPYILVPGNHDLIAGDKNPCFLKWSGMPALWYGFTVDNVLFIVLDSEEFAAGSYAKQIKWLSDELSKNKGIALVFLHRPLYAGKNHPMLPKEIKDKLHTLFKEHGVSMVVQGHDHLYNKAEVDGIQYVVTGGGGAPLVQGGFYHYMRIEVSGHQLVIEVIDIDGKVRDTFSIRR